MLAAIYFEQNKFYLIKGNDFSTKKCFFKKNSLAIGEDRIGEGRSWSRETTQETVAVV